MGAERIRKVAIVSDPLTEFGGEQRVLEVLHEMYPRAPIYTALLGLSNLPERFKQWHVVTPTFLGLPFHPVTLLIKLLPIRSLRLLLIPFYTGLDLSRYDLVISNGTFFAKGAKHPRHIAYLHTPPRFLYGYETESGMRSRPLLGLLLSPIDSLLRLWDFCSAKRVSRLICKSQEVQSRIKKFYGRGAQVINPPIAIATFSDKAESAVSKDFPDLGDQYYLIVSRLTKYKNFDLAVKACNLIRHQLFVVGEGGESDYLRSIAGSTVKFLGRVPDTALKSLYQGAKAFVFPVKNEDFGIVPVEAQSFGCPVIAHKSGGVLETVINGKTGILLEDLSVRGLAKILKEFDTTKYKKSECIANAKRFSKEKFIEKMEKVVATELEVKSKELRTKN